jgi:hypothetical protein
MAGILNQRCDASTLAHAERRSVTDVSELIVDDQDGMDSDDIDEALRVIARRRIPASSA